MWFRWCMYIFNIHKIIVFESLKQYWQSIGRFYTRFIKKMNFVLRFRVVNYNNECIKQCGNKAGISQSMSTSIHNLHLWMVYWNENKIHRMPRR